MKYHSLGFIGGGRITKIFLQALQNKDYNLSDVVVNDNNPEVLQALHQQFPAIQSIDTPSMAAQQKIVFIALHPPVISEVLNNIKEDVKEDTWIVSLAPKISSEKISTLLNTKKILRIIPNATSYINEGYNPYAFGKDVDDSEKGPLLDLLELLGHFLEVKESKLESYALLSAMLPTYFWPQWKTLLDLGVQTGLTKEECRDSIHQTMNASLNLLFSSGLNYGEVIDLIPVKPMAEYEEFISEAYKNKLLSLYEKIKPS